MNGLKYWDPEESTRTKWETTYASELQDRGLTQDFTGLSTLLLGQAQPKQFQSYEDEQPLGWIWYTYCTAPGDCNLSEPTSSGLLLEMPRELHGGNAATGSHYNWFAVTAESGKYNLLNYPAPDSICPVGWELANNTDGKTWSNLMTVYNLSGGEGEIQTRRSPFIISRAGAYRGKYGTQDSSSYGIWTALPTSAPYSAYKMAGWPDNLYPDRPDDKGSGLVARCVKRDDSAPSQGNNSE